MSLHLGRRIRAQAPFLIVLLVMVSAFGYLTFWPGHWRRGTGVIAVALLLAGVLRLLLSAPQAGLLAVRGRWRDALVYLALGGLILIVEIRLH